MDMYAAAASAAHSPNIWGALGCAVGYAGALFTSLDTIGDYVEFRRTTPEVRVGHRLKYTAKLSAAGTTVVTAGSVLALDANWFALTVLSGVFVALVVGCVLVARSAIRSGSAPVGATAPPPTPAGVTTSTG